MADTGQILTNVCDGGRRPIPQSVKWLARLTDGRSLSERKTHTFDELHGSTKLFEVPFSGNPMFDTYTAVVTADGYQDGAWMPIHLSPRGVARVDVMVLPKHEELNFNQAVWQQLKQRRRTLAQLIANSTRGNDASAGDQYSGVLEHRPESLAAFLNIMTALAEVRFPSGRGPLDYYWNICWPTGDPSANEWLQELDNRFKRDRFFCYVESGILSEFPEAVRRGMFDEEQDPSRWDHAGATESYKQTQFDVANVQLTFHGHDVATFVSASPDGSPRQVSCVKVEPDIDYYRDLAAHILLEYLPHKFTAGVSDPKAVYMLRWMAARASGREFDPLYTIESAGVSREVMAETAA